MNKAYNRINWVNDLTPLNDTNLNKIDVGLNEVDNRVINLDNGKLAPTDIASVFKNATIDDQTGIITFTRYDDSTVQLDTMLEKVVTNFTYDDDPTSPHYQSLVLTLADGTKKYIPMQAFINVYTFTDSATIAFSASGYNVTATIKAHSIGDAQMETGYLTDAQQARSDSEAYALGTRDGQSVSPSDITYENNSKYYSEQSAQSAQDAEDASQYARDVMVGGTFSIDENGHLMFTDNSAYDFEVDQTNGHLFVEVL